jgi:hypothetical protein
VLKDATLHGMWFRTRYAPGSRSRMPFSRCLEDSARSFPVSMFPEQLLREPATVIRTVRMCSGKHDAGAG